MCRSAVTLVAWPVLAYFDDTLEISTIRLAVSSMSMSVKKSGTVQRLLVLLVALALQVCAATRVEAQTALPEKHPGFLAGRDPPDRAFKARRAAAGRARRRGRADRCRPPISIVRILQAHTVTIDNTSAAAYTVSVDGKLAFNPAVNTA